MRADEHCNTCGEPLRRVDRGLIETRPHPHGVIVVGTYVNGVPTTVEHDTPDDVPGSEPFRYRRHVCGTVQEPPPVDVSRSN